MGHAIGRRLYPWQTLLIPGALLGLLGAAAAYMLRLRRDLLGLRSRLLFQAGRPDPLRGRCFSCWPDPAKLISVVSDSKNRRLLTIQRLGTLAGFLQGIAHKLIYNHSGRHGEGNADADADWKRLRRAADRLRRRLGLTLDRLVGACSLGPCWW